jgi:hypothetical protein
MTIEQDFLPVATAGGANVEAQATYITDSTRTLGQQPGVAASAFNNKALRQSSFVTSQLAQLVSNLMVCDTLDNGVTAQFLAQMTGALKYFNPVITQWTTGSGNHNITYKFMVASANATAGATYTNNGVTFTVSSTISSGTELKATGNGDPLLVAGTGAGTLTLASGTGDSTITFYAFRKPLYLRVRAIGGGGGGGGTGATSSTGGTGGTTTFGTSLLTAAGGVGGGGGVNASGGTGGTGGSATVATSATVIQVAAVVGGGGGAGSSGGDSTSGSGAGTPFGGSGGAGYSSVAGKAGAANTGAGGGGAGAVNAVALPSGGGGAGGYLEAILTSPLSTYAYAVGAAGTAGTGASFNGGAGGSGVIIVEEHYQ